MNLEETLENFKEALAEFSKPENERYLLLNNLSERCIAHKLAEYLQRIFADFHVDCEYNKVFSEGKVGLAIKRLQIPKEVIEAIAIDRLRKNDTYSVFP